MSLIIVTMTSWTKRIGNVKPVVESVMNNTMKPDRLYLNLSKTEFDGIKLPDDLVEYFDSDDRLIINWVDGENTKSMKKVFPILKYLDDGSNVIFDATNIPSPLSVSAQNPLILLPVEFSVQRDLSRLSSLFLITAFAAFKIVLVDL